MAREQRRDARPGSGPGRGTPRSRAGQRTRRTGAQRPAGPPPEEEKESGSTLDQLTRGLSATRRAIALIVVFALLTLSYASSLRIYFTQQQQISAQREELAESRLRVYDLQDQVDRWQDPEYVKAQARERLGWVVPGETGYVVLGPDGRPIDGSTQIARNRGLDTQSTLTWWQQLWDSMVTADKPVDDIRPGSSTPKPTPTRIGVSASPPPEPEPTEPTPPAPSPTHS